MDFVFDRSADSRVLKMLTVVDDATHESVAVVVERAIGGEMLTRIMDRICRERAITDHQDGQWQGILRQSYVELAPLPWCEFAPHGARKAQAERLH